MSVQQIQQIKTAITADILVVLEPNLSEPNSTPIFFLRATVLKRNTGKVAYKYY